MREELNTALKEYLQTRLAEIRFRQRLTQEQMADILQMDRRTFASVESGKFSLGTLSFLMYLFSLTEDRNKELNDIEAMFLKILNGDAA